MVIRLVEVELQFFEDYAIVTLDQAVKLRSNSLALHVNKEPYRRSRMHISGEAVLNSITPIIHKKRA